MPKVSVVIPCYNQGKFVDEAVNSVLSQTFQDFEIIIINDGSDDSFTNKLLKNYSKPKTKVITTKNKGVSMARNTGIKAAKGKYILPLDADDTIEPTYLDKAVKILEKNKDTGIVYCEAKFFGEKKGKWKLPKYHIKDMLLENRIFCSGFFRKSDWGKVEGYNSNMKDGYEDWDFWLSLISLGVKVYRIPEILFSYRIKKQSRNASMLAEEEKRLNIFIQILKNHQELYAANIDTVIEGYEIMTNKVLRLKRNMDCAETPETKSIAVKTENAAFSFSEKIKRKFKKLGRYFKKSQLIILSLFLIFLLVRVPLLAKDLATEEGSFIKTGVSLIIHPTHPSTYLDETHPDLIYFDKPPLSRILVGLGYLLSGEHVWGARSTPLLFSILQFFLIIFLIKKFYDGKHKETVLYGLLLLYSLTPLVIHGAGEIQIDYIVSLFLTVYLFGSYARLRDLPGFFGSKKIIFISAFLGFTTKYEPTLMAVCAVNVYMILKKIGWKKWLEINLISVTGITSYLAVFYLYTQLIIGSAKHFLVPIEIIQNVLQNFFAPKLQGIQNAVPSLNKFKSNITLFVFFINWSSITLLILFLRGLASKNRKNDFALFNIIIVTVFSLSYLAVGWTGLGYPRYFLPMMFSFLFIISLTIPDIFSFAKKYKLLSLSTALVALLVYFSNIRNWPNFFEYKFPANQASHLAVILIITTGIFFVVRTLKKKQLLNFLSYSLLIYFLIFSLAHIRNDVFSEKIVTTTYGTVGIKDVAKFLKWKLPKDALIVANDNIGFYYGDHYYFWDIVYPYADRLEKFVENDLKKVSAFVVPESTLDSNPKIREYVNSNMKKHQIGTIQFYYIP